MEILYGRGVNGHMVQGKLHIIRHIRHTGNHTFTTVEKEKERFMQACEKVKAELSELQKQTARQVGEKEAEIFSIHQMMIEEEEFREGVYKCICDGKSAEEAVQEVSRNIAEMFASMDSAYIRAREADIRSVSERITEILVGSSTKIITHDIPCIIAADDLTPAETVMLDKNVILGFVTEGGSENSHTAILARTMDIPAVVGIGSLEDRYENRECILDGNNGILYIDPDETVKNLYNDTCRNEQQQKKTEEQYRGKRCINGNGASIRICANAGSIEDIQEAIENDAEGIGLFRSEFLFMRYDKCPTEEEQFRVYKEALQHMTDKETVIRTLDAGADKQLKWLPQITHENNPALGLRAIRLCLRHRTLLYTQLRALYRAAFWGPISAMIPMITVPDEFRQVLKIAEQVKESLRAENIQFNADMPIGIMIETPSAALYAEELAELCDFFSIGTNDLIQYTLAADRENPEVTYLTKPTPESVLYLIQKTAAAALEKGISVGVCGELAVEESLIPFFLQSGITKLSVTPTQILRTRRKVFETIRKESLQKNKI